MSNWFDDPRRPHNTRDPRPISPFTDSGAWSSPRARPVQVGIPPIARDASHDELVATPAAPTTLDALVAGPTALDAVVAGPSSGPTALDALVAGTSTTLDTHVATPVARVALARRPIETPASDDPACAPRMTMFQEKP